MTNVAEFKEMLQQEIDEPLDYPRLEGPSGHELAQYNDGYRTACELVLSENDCFTDIEWARWKVGTCKACIIGYPEDGRGWLAGRRAAFAWALAELEGLEGLETESQSISGAAIRAAARDSVFVDRARYNYLLEVERQAQAFAESFARWED